MLNPANLSPQAQHLLYAEGVKPGAVLQAAQLARVLGHQVDSDHNGLLSEAEGKAAGLTPKDLNLINQELKKAPPPVALNLDLPEAMAVSFPDKLPDPSPGKTDAPGIFGPEPAPKPAPAPPPKHTLGNDALFLDTNPVLKMHQDLSSEQIQNLDKVNFHSEGHAGPVTLASDMQVDDAGQPQGGIASLSVVASPALKLGARLDTQPLWQNGSLPQRIDLSGAGSVGRLNYNTQLSYDGTGLSAAQAGVGFKLADSFALGIEGLQQKTPEGMALKDIGFSTTHQFGDVSLSSKVNLDTLTGKTSAGGSLSVQLLPGVKASLSGGSDGENRNLGLSITATN